MNDFWVGVIGGFGLCLVILPLLLVPFSNDRTRQKVVDRCIQEEMFEYNGYIIDCKLSKP